MSLRALHKLALLPATLVVLAACTEAPNATVPASKLPGLKVGLDGSAAANYSGPEAAYGMLTISLQGLLGERQRRVLATVAEVDHVTIEIKASRSSEYRQTVDKAAIASGQTTATFSGVVAGPVTVTMRAFNAAKAQIGYVAQPALVEAGQASTIDVTLQLDPTYVGGGVGDSILGDVNLNGTIVDGAATGAAQPTPTPGAGATPTPQPTATAPAGGAGSYAGTYTVAGASRAVAVDAAGNAWVAHKAGTALQPSLTQLSSAGAALRTVAAGGGIGYDPSDVAIDPAGGFWAANEGADAADPARGVVAKFNADGSRAFSVTTDIGKKKLALDAAGNVWVTNQRTAGAYPAPQGGTLGESHTLFKISPTGSILGNFAVTGPIADVAIDSAGNAWVAHGDTSSGKISKLSATGQPLEVYSLPAGLQPQGLAFDGAGYAWIAASRLGVLNGEVVKMSMGGLIWGSYQVGVGPREVAIDAKGGVWVANATSGTLTQLNAAGQTLGTFQSGALPAGLAAGASGVWAANTGASNVARFVP